MHFDEIHTKLFAFAKKGTQDNFFLSNTEKVFVSKKRRTYSQFGNTDSLDYAKNIQIPSSKKVIEDLKGLQLTLFDY